MLVPVLLPILFLVETAFSTDVVEIRGSQVEVEERNPKLFYVSTTVSTVSATARCYQGVGGGLNPPTGMPVCCYAGLDGTNPGTSCRRRRRRFVADGPAAVPDGCFDESPQAILEEEEEEHSRDAKLMLYWVTTTSTTTTYTSTSTLATLNCTPSGWTMTSCITGR